MKRVWIALAAVLAVILPARLYTVMTLAEARTGLYAPADEGKIFAVAIASACGVLLLMVLSAGRKTELSPLPLQSVGTALLAALTGLFTAGQSLAALTVSSGEGNRGMEIVLSLFGFLAAAAFLAAAYDFASGSGLLRRHPLLGLLPSVWGCLGLISLFINYAATVNRLENVYNTFTVALLLLFLFSQAKFMAGMESRKSGRRVLLFGPAAAAMAFLTAVPDCVRYFGGKASAGLFPVGVHLLCIVMAVYILVYLAAVLRLSKTAPILKVAAASDETAAPAEAQENPEREDSGQDGPDLLQACADFLKNSYHASEKFVEIRENAARVEKGGKS